MHKRIRVALIFALGTAAAAGGTGRGAFVSASAEAAAANPAVAAGFYSLFTNPALLAALPHYQVGFTHEAFPVDAVAGEAVGAGVPLGRYGTAALAATTTYAKDVERWGPGNEPLGTFLYHDDNLSVGYGLGVGDWVGGGLAVNYYRHQGGAETGINYQSFAVNGGLSLTSPAVAGGPIILGVTGYNLYATSRKTLYGDYRDETDGAVGVSWGRYFGEDKIGFAVGAVSLKDDVPFGVTAEYVWSGYVAARGGASATPAAEGDIAIIPLVGGGVNLWWLSFDYCYEARGAGGFHFFSLSANPGRETRSMAERRMLVKRWLAEAKSYIEAGAYERAEELYKKVLAVEPANAEAQTNISLCRYYILLTAGTAYLQNGEWDKARGALGEALELAPGDFLATEYLALTEQREAEQRERVEEENRLAERLTEAQKELRRGKYARAITICDEVLTAYPDNEKAAGILAEAKKMRAEALAAANKPIPPIEEPTKTTTIPAEAASKYREAVGLLDRGAVPQAIGILAGLVSEFPTYGAARAKLVEALLYQGLDYYSKGSLAAAIQAWKQALSLDPGNAKAKRYLAKAEGEVK